MTRLKHWCPVCMLICTGLMSAQARNDPPDTVAGIAVNYDEAKVGTYVLADPLTLGDGQRVRDAKTWWAKRRPEIVTTFETGQYGRAPGRPASESFSVFDAGTPALNGKAIRKQVLIYLSKDKNGPSIQLLV